MRFGAVAVCLAACGSGSHPAISDASHDAPTDAATDIAIDARIPVQTYIKASDVMAGDRFGATVAVAGDGHTFAVGAPGRASHTGAVYVFVKNAGAWSQQGIVTASNADPNDQFGSAIAISNDGNTLAVAALTERSCATGIDGDQTSNACAAGAVYVFVRSGTVWTQQAYVKASNTTYNDGYSRAFGQGLALSGDGNTLAVGDPADSSNATGIDGSQTDISDALSGAVFVFTRSNATWTQQAYVKASNTNASDNFGGAVALSGDGSTMVVGAGSEASGALGVNGSQVDNSAPDSGAAYVFTRTGVAWSQQAYVKASNTGRHDFFGYGVALAADGATFAIGAPGEASAATGIDGDQSDDSQLSAGAVYVFANGSNGWSQQAYCKEQVASNNGDYFGNALTLSANGDVLASGAYLAHTPTGMGTAFLQSGAAYEYSRASTTWSTGPLWRADNAGNDDLFGGAIGMASDASVVVIGASCEASASTDPHDNSAACAGAVYVSE